MGTTGSSDSVSVNKALPDILSQVREFATVPLAVGFGVANRNHFNTVADAGADGVVIGSRIVDIVRNSQPADIAKNVEAFCREVSGKGQPARPRSPASRVTTPGQSLDSVVQSIQDSDSTVLPPRFGEFGGQYVPEALVDCLAELEAAHKSAMQDPEFQKELRSYFGYINRPSQIYFAENLTKDASGAKIWLKREDL